MNQDFQVPDELVGVAAGFVQTAVAESPQGSPGLFGRPVSVPPSASALDRLIGLTGRDPAWVASATVRGEPSGTRADQSDG